MAQTPKSFERGPSRRTRNPQDQHWSGADLAIDQWRDVARLVAERGLVPFVDLAYQGFGHGLEADAAGTRLVVEAAEQALVAQSCDKNFGLYRERTANRFAAPMVLRIPGGFFKVGDPWHSQTNEVQFVHNPGWLVAVPSNAEDAVGLLRTGLRGNDPVVFFEHRSMLDDVWARRPYPGDDYVLPFGRAKKTREGNDITIVTWGAMVPRCEEAAKHVSADVIDLRTLMPWDKEMVLESVRCTRRCLIVHEDLQTGGFGAEIAAVVADEAFLDLDAPVARVTMPDIPSPHNPVLLNWAVPSVERIRAKIDELVGF